MSTYLVRGPWPVRRRRKERVELQPGPGEWAAPRVGVVGPGATWVRASLSGIWRKWGIVSVSSTLAWSRVAHEAGFTGQAFEEWRLGL